LAANFQEMAMRQRPKVANYTARNDFKNQLKKSTPPKDSLPPRTRQREGNGESDNQPNTIIPKKVPSSKTVESKRIRHASSGKPVGPPIAEKPSEGGGVMTKFRNLDDIPDITDDYNPFEMDEEVEDESYYANTQYEVVSHHSQRSSYSQNNLRVPQPVIQQSHNPPPLPLEINRGNYNHHKNYSDPEEESEIEEDDDIPKLQYGGGQKWAPSHPPQNDYDDDWNSDDDEDYNHLPPLPSVSPTVCPSLYCLVTSMFRITRSTTAKGAIPRLQLRRNLIPLLKRMGLPKRVILHQLFTTQRHISDQRINSPVVHQVVAHLKRNYFSIANHAMLNTSMTLCLFISTT
jgi:hypothetical protein